MPTRPKTFEQQRAEEWARQSNRQRRRLTHHALYHTAAWKRLARVVLSEQPVCVGYQRECSMPATDVDHIEPLAKRPDLALVRTNLQGLCKACHTRKTGDGK
jgi:5-methylcytosine-specific restriction protein A